MAGVAANGAGNGGINGGINGAPNIASPSGRRSPRGPVTLVLDLFSSLWFGITLLVLLFIYCSVGSAVPALRQIPLFEMTEFEWFHWWPFDLLVALFTLNMFVITVRRIPLRFMNLGVWGIHFGIITMTLGSYVYFSTKVEGDAPVFRRQVVIQAPGSDELQTLVAIPGNQTTIATPDGEWKFAIGATNTEPNLPPEAVALKDKGEDLFEVMVAVTPPQGNGFVRFLYGTHDEFARDLIPGSGYASNAIGRRLVNADLRLSQDLAPTTTFHVKDTWALFVRRPGEKDWSQRIISGLPRYNDYVSSRDLVLAEHDITPRMIDIEVPPGEEPDALGDTPVRISGFLRYAQMQERWEDGGKWVNPVLRFTASMPDIQDQQFELVAFDAEQSGTPDGGAQFVWLQDKSQLEQLPKRALGAVTITINETGKSVDVPLTAQTVVGRDGAFTALPGTDLRYRIVAVPGRLDIEAQTVAIAMVEVETPEGRFTRMVADQPAMTRDIRAEGDTVDPHGRTADAPDPRLTMTFEPPGSWFIFAGYPGGLTFVQNSSERRLVTKDVNVGETIQLARGTFKVDSFFTHATTVRKPFVVPKEQQNRDLGVALSMIRLEVGTGSNTEAQWIPYNQYAFPNAQFRYAGRFAYLPRTVTLADGSEVEVLFSRERRYLPAAIALQEFALDEHVGGYSGSAATIRNYVSQLRFFDGDQNRWTDPVEISVNSPTGYGGFWYFQANWDPPMQERAGSGMIYTGLGIGNRNGVYAQLAGSTLSVIGMIFAFYVKPVLKRRRAEQQRLKAFGTTGTSADQDADDESTASTSSPEPAVEVGAQKQDYPRY
ncbi:MAG: hypothetical protein ACPGXK_14635 [Phycisphaerae bacterium]